jgi:SAM-dependent methyltransferase
MSAAAARRMRLAAVLTLCLLPPHGAAVAQPAEASSPNATGAADCHDYHSRLLEGVLRICDGTVMPEPTERTVMPVLAACPEKIKGKTVLDLGTGSGILALFAAKLGAAKVIATDIEPRAIACARENARKLGFDSIVETRLVDPKDPAAYSVIRPGESFDVIVGTPPHEVNRVPFVDSGGVDPGISPNDYLRLGLSLVKGLPERLNKDGAAILLYQSALMHDILVRYARHLGLAVEHHPPQALVGSDWLLLYNSFAAGVGLTERLDPATLMLPLSSIDPDGPGGIEGPGAYVKLDYLGANEGVFPPLWGGVARVVPGLMVIRR